MKLEQILFDADGGVATITLNRPDALNAITPKMLEELNAAMEAATIDESIGVIILTGAGKAFSAGVDLKSLGDRELVNGKVGPILDDPARALIEKITRSPKAVIARVNGFCFTGALEIALGCDIIVCAEEAKLGDTHAKWGLRPTWGMSQRLPRAVGMAKAMELSMTAATFTGAEAAAWGLASRAVPRDNLDAAVNELAQQILENSRGSIAAYKDLYYHTPRKTISYGLTYEAETEYTIPDTEDRVAQFRK